jgi:hypothetical protein
MATDSLAEPGDAAGRLAEITPLPAKGSQVKLTSVVTPWWEI